ncbi:MAG: hypothetical protein JW395_1797 [Nitrospira sp.]|nr:hypothetical protein [Nitrospira sp.]
MHQFSVHRHPYAAVRDETHPIDRHLRLLWSEPRQRHTNDAPVQSVQDRVHSPIGLPIRLRQPAIEQHQLECVETNRQVKKQILLAWRTTIIADHNNLSELLQRLTRLPLRIGKQTPVLGQFLCEMQCLSRP